MLKRKALRKILITTLSCFTLFVLYLIPTKINDNYLNTDIDIIYTSNVYNSEIYLLGENNYLVKSNISLKQLTLNDKVNEILEHLKINSSYKKPIGLKGIIPENTNILSIEIDEEEVIIDFDSNLLNVDKSLEERLIESIVYSVTSLEDIEEVVIKVNGKKLTNLPQTNKMLPDELSRDFGINKVYDITNRNSIQKVILYYVENISNNNYYVPVTKYVNDDREKINIIIDNLSSSYIYEGNLSSYLRSDIDVLEYKNDNNIMEINFNKDIFPSDKLLEAVEYTLSYSIFDNYDVDKIVLKVNGVDLKEIDRCSIFTSCTNE